MSHPSMPGFRIMPMPAPIRKDIIERFQSIVTPHISDNMQRLCGVIGLKPYHRQKKLVGRAVTVKVRPGDNLMIHKALDMAEPGDVIVVDGGGELSQALVGELMQMHAQVRGVAGFVIDGAVRDVAAFYAADFPCFARGNTHRGPFKEGPGEINVPVAIAAGDLIVGDEDGLVAVPAEQLENLLVAATAQAQREQQRKEAILAGQDKRGWIDTYLKQKGVIA
jgi:regulator of RNase E activity RraA